jgi:hypothetical protein
LPEKFFPSIDVDRVVGTQKRFLIKAEDKEGKEKMVTKRETLNSAA